MEKDELIKAIKERLEFMTDEKLKQLLKQTKPITEADIKADIERHSKSIR